MKKSSRIRLLVLCLILSIVSFAFACDMMGGGGSTGGSSNIQVEDYVDNGRVLNYNTYGEVKVDGIIDDEIWANQNKVVRELEVGGANYVVEMSAYLADNGAVMYMDVQTNGGVYVNTLRDSHNNSGLEVYIASGDKTAPQMNTWEIPMHATGFYGSGLYTWLNNYGTANCYVDVKTQIDGWEGTVLPSDDVNLDPDKTSGYTIEFYIPYTNLKEGQKPSSIAMTAAVLHMASFNSTTRNWVDIHAACDGASGFSNLSQRYIFNEQGYWDGTPIARNYKVNGVEGADGIVENGRLELDIPNVGSTGSIIAVPDAGYMFDYLIVNGVKQQSPVYNIKRNMGDLDIEVGFKSLDGIEVVENATITVTGLYKAPLGYTLDGKSIRLVSSQGVFDAEIVNDVVSFTSVPAGKYEISIVGLTGLETEIVLEKDVADYTVAFEFDLFDDDLTNSTFVESYDESTKSYTITSTNHTVNNARRLTFNQSAGEIVWAQMTVGFDQDTAGVSDVDDVLLNGIGGLAKGSSMDIGLWWVGGQRKQDPNPGTVGKELRLRTAGTAGWGGKPISELTTASSTDDLQARVMAGEKICIAVSLVDNVASIFYKMEVDTEWYFWRSIDEYSYISDIYVL